MKILVATDVFRRIEQELLFTLEDAGHRLMVREIGPAVQVVQNEQIPLHPPSMENMDSNGEVPGFEDLDDEVAAEHDMAQSNLRLEDSFVNVLGREVVKATPGLLENSNSKNASEGSEDNIEHSIHSGSRTKTVSSSQIGYSEEVFKLSQQFKQPLGIAATQPPSRDEVQQPLGFEKIGINQGNDLVFVPSPKALGIGVDPLEDGERRDYEGVDSPPPGLENIAQENIAQETDGIKPPPGFEAFAAIQPGDQVWEKLIEGNRSLQSQGLREELECPPGFNRLLSPTHLNSEAHHSLERSRDKKQDLKRRLAAAKKKNFQQKKI